MLFRVLGPLEAEIDAVRIVPPGPHVRAVLTALLLQPNTVVATHRLMEAVWGDDPPAKADNALQRVVARLRKALGPHGGVIVTRPPGYLLLVGDDAIDASRFEAQVRAGRSRAQTDPAASVALLEEALALWRGPAYGEFADGFARAAATRLEELRLAALEERAELLLTCGLQLEAAASANDLAAQHPLRERPVGVLMRALHAGGRAAEALEAYRQHRKVVAQELGLEPSQALRDLEAAILRDDLELPPRSTVASPLGPAATPKTPRTHLPWRPSPLVGRDAEVQALEDALETRRLVTLVGPGGVGKTRLALEVAHRLAERGRAVWWADLLPVSRDRVADALAEATGVAITGSADPVGTLGAALGAHRGVLFVDNAEHLLEPLAVAVERLLDAVPGLAVFATSRERLALDTESVRVLAPLPLPSSADGNNPAVRLFLERTADLVVDALADDDVAVVAEMCRRLDGLPLAIELAAAQARTFGLRDLARRLGQRLDVLAGGRRTADARHRTLRAVVDWSATLLTVDEARLLHRLAIFPGAFSLDQVEAVCADARLPRPAVAPLLARLVEQSLVQTAPGRFWLLETLRTYASEGLAAAGETEDLRRRHAADTAERLAALDRQLWTPSEPAAVAALTDLVVDLHASWTYAADADPSLALQLAGDVYDFAYIRQRLDLLSWGLQAASADGDPLRLARALAGAAAAAWSAGRLDDAEQHGARAVAVAGSDDPVVARAVSQLGNLAMFTGRHDEAIASFRAAAELHRSAGEHVRALVNEVSVSQVFVYAGRTSEARQRMQDLLPRARGTGNPSLRSWACYVAGEAEAAHDVDAALAAYAESVEQGARVDARLFMMISHSSAIALAARSEPAPDALEQFSGALGQWEDLRNELAQWWLLRHVVVLLDRVGAAADAAVLLGAVLAARDRHADVGPFRIPFDDVVAGLRTRLGERATDDALAEGAGLPYAAAVAHARRAIADAQQQWAR